LPLHAARYSKQTSNTEPTYAEGSGAASIER